MGFSFGKASSFSCFKKTNSGTREDVYRATHVIRQGAGLTQNFFLNLPELTYILHGSEVVRILYGFARHVDSLDIKNTLVFFLLSVSSLASYTLFGFRQLNTHAEGPKGIPN